MWSFFSRDVVKDFGYELGPSQDVDPNLCFWKLHSGRRKSNGEEVTIFTFESSSSGSQSMFEFAKSCVKRIKTLRHPSILTYVDSLETDKLVYLVTEKVTTLSSHLSQNEYSESQKKLAISWGLYQIASGLSFLNKDCHFSHNNVCLASIYVDRAGEWRLFGLEYVVPMDQQPPTKVMAQLKIYNPPEIENSSHSKSHGSLYDSWGFGCLIWEVFNGPLPKSSSLKSIGKIPENLSQSYGELTTTNTNSRITIPNFMKKSTRKGYFKNKFVETMLFLREIHIKDNDEKTRFFNNLSSSLDSFPQDICLYKVLPELINAFEFGNAGSSILSPMFKLGKLLSDEEYQQKIVPCLVKMFSSKDRNTRAKLLQQMEEFIDHFTPTVINAQIFQSIQQGFLDSSPVIREYTIKCMFHLAPKLNYQNLNEEMLKHFARMQTKDDQGGIRTNTTVCLGKIASYLHPQTRKKVLINAFVRALRDPFPPARTAAILAFSATEHFYSINDCATKVLPALCHFTVDPEKSVRDQAFKSIGGFLQKLHKVSDDPSLAEEMEKEMQSMTPSASASASWTSWAVTSLVDKLHMPSLSRGPTPNRASSPVTTSPERESKEKKPKENNKVTERLKDEELDNSASVEEVVADVDDWNTEWNEEETPISSDTVSKSSKMSLKSEAANAGGEWDIEEWESFENADTFQESGDNRISSYFSNAEPEDPFQDMGNVKASSSSSSLKMSSKNENKGWDIENSDWDNWGENSLSAPASKNQERQQKSQEDRLLREEKRKQKLKERQMAKASKLGAQKIS